MRRHHPIVLAGAFLMLPAAADAQQIPEALYRSDTPLVLEWETTAVFRNRSPIIAAFSEAYEARGRPRIAVFWNRRFDDRLSDWTTGALLAETERTELNVSVRGERGDGSDASATVSGDLDAGLSRRRTVAARWRRPEQDREGLPEALAFQLRSGFAAALGEAGVALFDRAAIMRLQDHEAPALDLDAQRLEADALLEHADLLIEVLAAREAGTPLGMVFQVNVKDVRSGQLVHSLTSAGRAGSEATEGRWEASENGFARIPAQGATATKIGEELALETMDGLTARWR